MAKRELTASFCTRISEVPAADWDAIAADGGLFSSHHFLSLLEDSGVVGGEDSGWQPAHLLLHEGDQLIAVMPLYLKGHSWGEYVFDWSWADAWHRLGLRYYPKLVAAIPMTPVTGGRLALAPGQARERVTQVAMEAIGQFADQHDLSSCHILFATAAETESWRQQGLAVRTACNFQWFNRGYGSYDDFLADMTSRARKTMRRERGKANAQGLHIRRLPGNESSAEDWRQMYLFYRDTCARRGYGGHLNERFFQLLGERMADSTLLVQARTAAADGDRPVAGSLFFHCGDQLYGRYWGCVEDYDSLHFELCYHQGIEFSIERQLAHFDPGVQGQHKIRRGFIPVLCQSAHWVAAEQLRPAVADFCRREQQEIERYSRACREMLPFQAARLDLREPPAKILAAGNV